MTYPGASYWRDKARPIIREVLAETAGKPEREIKAALREAYPFGPRQYHPYKIWCDEIRRQRKTKPATGPCFSCGHAKGAHRNEILTTRCHAAACTCDAYAANNPNQLEMA